MAQILEVITTLSNELPFITRTVHRTMDAKFLNSVANAPEVRPWLLFESSDNIDLTPLVEDPGNICVQADHGGFLALNAGGGFYEVHSMFRKETPRLETVRAMREGMRIMFLESDCLELRTVAPWTNKPAEGLVQQGHFLKLFSRAMVFNGAGASYYALTFLHWLETESVCGKVGAWFHDQLEQAKRSAGSSSPTHHDDAAHDRAVGATVLMLAAGNAAKAVALYNNWASFAGYATIALLRTHPAVLDVRDAVVTLDGGRMEVLACR